MGKINEPNATNGLRSREEVTADFAESVGGFDAAKVRVDGILANLAFEIMEKSPLDKMLVSTPALCKEFLELKQELRATLAAIHEDTVPTAVMQKLEMLKSIGANYQRLVKLIEAELATLTEQAAAQNEGAALVEKFRRETSGAIAAPPEELEAPVLEDVGGTNSDADRAEQASATLAKAIKIASGAVTLPGTKSE